MTAGSCGWLMSTGTPRDYDPYICNCRSSFNPVRPGHVISAYDLSLALQVYLRQPTLPDFTLVQPS